MSIVLSFISVISSAFSAVLFFDFISVLQQCGYSAEKCLKWLYKLKNKVFIRAALAVLPLVFISLLKEIFAFDDTAYLVFYAVCAYICAYVLLSTYRIRVKAKFTKRLIRIVFLTAVMCSITFYFADCFLRAIFGADASYSVILTVLFPFYLILSSEIWLPYEKYIYKKYIKRCKNLLKKRDKLIKIGITGSAGKTSVKEFLAEMLVVDFKTYATPKSYNTPLGICLSVKEMPKDAEIFIAEMGARKKGDIAELCEIVEPDVGIITCVLRQHMETFGSLENVKNTKYELIEALSGGGTAIFSSDNEDTKRLYELTKKKKILAGINGKEVRAKGVKVTGQGTEFTLVIGRDKYYLKTKLLGRHNVTNICLAAAAAKELGVSPRRIAAAVERLKPPEHRLQPFVTANGVTVIDDGYNANIDGVRNAAETLKEIAGRKFAVVSGIAEGGSCSRELNEEVGKLLKDAVNVLIATGVYADYIFAGARGGDCKVLKAKDLASAENILKTRVVSGDTVIFINDLPDNY